MLLQDLVEAHADRVSRSVADLEEKMAVEMDAVAARVSSYALSVFPVTGKMSRHPADFTDGVLAIEDEFGRVLVASGFNPLVLAFVSNFVGQVDEFATLYGEMGPGLPEIFLAEDDVEVLSNQAAAAILVIEGHSLRANLELRQLLSRSLGEPGALVLAEGISEIVRKVFRIGPVARDQVMLFFRNVGILAYRRGESLGKVLKYSCVGPMGGKHRKFCASLIGKGPFTREEIGAMDNGQVPGVFDNCGGYGCKHWWGIAEVS